MPNEQQIAEVVQNYLLKYGGATEELVDWMKLRGLSEKDCAAMIGQIQESMIMRWAWTQARREILESNGVRPEEIEIDGADFDGPGDPSQEAAPEIIQGPNA